jgi:predicted membrane protein (TIGR00267 family)
MSGIFAKSRLNLVAGLCDGILTALILAGGTIFHPGSFMSLPLALRIAAAAAMPGAFIFFVAHYAELRRELVDTERQLNVLAHGLLATTQLGRAVLQESFFRALIATVATFIGALIPLLTSMVPTGPVWLGGAVAITALALLGFFLGRTAYGGAIRWALGLAVAGAVVAYVGMKLSIV